MISNFGSWYLNEILRTLKLIYQIKVTQGITGSIKIRVHIKLEVWHLDVGLFFHTSVIGLLVGLLIP